MISTSTLEVSYLRNKKIAFIGDSITADNRSNYISLLLQQLTETIDVNTIEIVNDGVDSSSIIDALDRLPELIIEENPDIFIVFIGVNDSKIFKKVECPLLSPDRYYQAYKILLERIDAEGPKDKILMTMPELLFDEINNGPFLANYWYWKPEIYVEYVNIIKKLAEEHSCHIADIYEAFKHTNIKERLFYDDGVHPNIYGHKIIATELLKTIKHIGSIK